MVSNFTLLLLGYLVFAIIGHIKNSNWKQLFNLKSFKQKLITMHLALHYLSSTDTALIETIMIFRYCPYSNYFYGGSMT